MEVSDNIAREPNPIPFATLREAKKTGQEADPFQMRLVLAALYVNVATTTLVIVTGNPNCVGAGLPKCQAILPQAKRANTNLRTARPIDAPTCPT
jgi:hypothetical protein